MNNFIFFFKFYFKIKNNFIKYWFWCFVFCYNKNRYYRYLSSLNEDIFDFENINDWKNKNNI
jgi:hypothetical protein